MMSDECLAGGSVSEVKSVVDEVGEKSDGGRILEAEGLEFWKTFSVMRSEDDGCVANAGGMVECVARTEVVWAWRWRCGRSGCLLPDMCPERKVGIQKP